MKKTIQKSQGMELPWEYAVVGEHQANPMRLLLQGNDGQFYELHLATGQVSAVEPDSDWLTDSPPYCVVSYTAA